MRQSIILGTIFALCFFAASCQQKKADPLEKTLNLSAADDPVSLDPRKVRSLKDLTIVKQLYDGLMRIDAQGLPQPAIAASYTVSDDLRTYTFTLRQAKWSTGEDLTAFDFERSWKEALDPSFASDYSYMLYSIKNARNYRENKCPKEDLGVKALNDYTLVVELESPTPYFLELTAFPTFYPVNAQDQVVSNGPFKVLKWEPQVCLHIEKNPLYWDAQAVNLKGITFSFIADSNTEHLLFEKGELHWLGQPLSANIASELITKFKEEGKLESYPIAGTFWLKFNTEKYPFCHAKIRRALGLALCRQEIITHILCGNQSVATGPVPRLMGLVDAPYFRDDSSAEAAALFNEALEELGLSREDFSKVVLNYPPSERNTKIVQQVQHQWRKSLGIEVQLVATENQVYRKNVRLGNFQIGTGDWIGDFNDPIAFLEIFQYLRNDETGNGMNDTGWHDEAFSSLLEQSSREADSSKRHALLGQAEKILVDAMPIIPLYHYAFDYTKKDAVQNVFLSPLGIADFKLVNLDE